MKRTKLRGRSAKAETDKGILLAGGITFLLNATCWGGVLYLADNQHHR